MNNNIRIVPIQKLCVLCGHELHIREHPPRHECRGFSAFFGDTTQGLAGRLCRACLRLLHEQVFFRELEQRPKIVRVQEEQSTG